MGNRFDKYLLYVKENGRIIGINPNAIKLADEAFFLFKELYDTNYGSIHEDDNLISIHTGGWSENESLIYEFMETGWWFKYHEITAKGGHYFFNTDIHNKKEWKVNAVDVGQLVSNNEVAVCHNDTIKDKEDCKIGHCCYKCRYFY